MDDQVKKEIWVLQAVFGHSFDAFESFITAFITKPSPEELRLILMKLGEGIFSESMCKKLIEEGTLNFKEDLVCFLHTIYEGEIY